MSSWVWIAPVVFLLFIVFLSFLLCFDRSRSWGATKILQWSLLLSQRHGKRKSPSLCILLTCVLPQIFFTHNIAFDSNVFWAELEYPTSCTNSLTITCFLPNIHRIVVLAWVKLYLQYLCLTLLSFAYCSMTDYVGE